MLFVFSLTGCRYNNPCYNLAEINFIPTNGKIEIDGKCEEKKWQNAPKYYSLLANGICPLGWRQTT